MAFWSAIAAPVLTGIGASLFAPKPDNSAGLAMAKSAEIQSGISQEMWDNYKQNFMPLEKQLISEAQKAGSPEEIAAAQARAGADVTGAFDRANRATESRMQAYGINPASPAYASNLRSSGLAEGAAYAGAKTNAYNRQKDLGYSRLHDVVQLGKGLPSQAISGLSAASGSAGQYQGSLNSQFLQNQQNMQNVGYALNPIVNAGIDYFSKPSSPTSYSDSISIGKGSFESAIPGYGTIQYANGGKVRSKRLSKSTITPHMNRSRMMHYANGGSVGLEPSRMNMMMRGPGNGTSDSIPAMVDNKAPASLSNGEFVMVAEVPRLSGEEILQAINKAGLEKREGRGRGEDSEMEDD